jgi:hypothetical protein
MTWAASRCAGPGIGKQRDHSNKAHERQTLAALLAKAQGLKEV